LALLILVCVGLSGCSDQADPSASATPATSTPTVQGDVNGLVDIGGGRRIYVRCTGTGSPTVILEGGDEDTSASYAFAVPSLAKVTRDTCLRPGEPREERLGSRTPRAP